MLLITMWQYRRGLGTPTYNWTPAPQSRIVDLRGNDNAKTYYVFSSRWLVHGFADGIVEAVGELRYWNVNVAVDLQPVTGDLADK